MSIRIGIVGAGVMARFHAQGFRQAGAEVVALADPGRERALASAAELAIPAVHPDLAAMIAAERLDAVSLAIPNHLHAPLAIQALAAGLHVFCEKPPARNAAEAQSMRRAALDSGRVLRFNLNNRCRPESLALRTAVRAGGIGRLNGIQAVWVRRSGIPGFGGWFTTRACSGGGPLIDLVHMLDLGLWLAGYPAAEHVLARSWDDFSDDRSRKGPWGIGDGTAPVDVEMACHGSVALAGGTLLSFRTSWAEMVEREHIQVALQGVRGGAVLERSFARGPAEADAADRCVLLAQAGGKAADTVIPCAADPAMGRIASAAAFVAACQGAETPLGTPDEAVALMRIIDAIYASAAQGVPISLPAARRRAPRLQAAAAGA